MSSKSTQQPVESKTVQHVLSYPLVKQLVDFLLSFSLINYLYTQLLPVYNLINQNVVSKFLPIIKPVDERADQVLTDVVDKTIIPQGEKYVSSIKETANYPLKTYVKPANDFTVEQIHKYLPNQTLKIDSNLNELEKSVEIAKQLGTSLYNTVKAKSTEVSNDVLSTYKKEVATSKDNNTISKNITAGVNTATKSYETYVKPIQEQTTAVFNDVTQKGKARAEELVDQAKSNISRGKKSSEQALNEAKEQIESVEKQIEQQVNGAVSASA
ncbi:hypothetical protein DICA3_F07404 [Diutina catenulata]